MSTENIYDFDNKLIGQIYNVDKASETMFPTPEECTFQFGVGVVHTDKTLKTHVHKTALREIRTTSEFLYVVNGQMDIKILDEHARLIKEISLTRNMGLLQFYGGHAISLKKGTKYFELKQGPYMGRDYDKFDVEEIK